MSRDQRKQHAAQHHTQPAAIAMLSDAFRVPPMQVLDALRSRFPGIIPEQSAADAFAAQIGDTGMVNTVCSHDTMTEARSMGSDDHETLYGCCTGCGIPMIGTRFYSHPDEVVCRAMTDGEITREKAA